MTDTADPLYPWLFCSQIVACGGVTLITGQYRVPSAFWIALGLGICSASYLAGGGVLEFFAPISAPTRDAEAIQLIVTLLLSGSLPLLFLGKAILHGRRERTTHRYEEEEILAAVKHLLEAEAVEQYSPGV